MKRRIVLFDIDRTIFDTDRMSRIFDKEMLKILKTSNLVKFEKAKKTYKQMLQFDRDFRVEEYVRVISKAFDFTNQEKLTEVFFGSKFAHIYRDSVYPETYKILDELKVVYRLGIFSEGELKFQNHKFESMGLGKYFDRDLVFIVPAKDNKETLEKIPKGSIVVDDKRRICEFLAENGVKSVWLNKRMESEVTEFPVVHNLLELSLLL